MFGFHHGFSTPVNGIAQMHVITGSAFPVAALCRVNYLFSMQTVFRLNTDELDEQFLASVRATFPHKEIEIAVAEVDETAHLLRSEANRERLLRALADVEAGRNLVTVPAAQLE